MVQHVLALALTCAAAPQLVLGQDGQEETIKKLLARVEALEREVTALKQTGAAVGNTAQPDTATAAPKPDIATAAVLAEPETPEASRFTFHGYADAGFARNVDGGSVKKFALGEVDLFATARISPKLTVLIEAAFETDNQLAVASVPVNLERLLLQYRQSDYFNLDIGSYRTAIGFYSTAYLRGSWLQTALTRPKLFTFEDDGGFLPLHNVGLSANGKVPSGGLGLHYVVEVGSSRNYAQPGRTGFGLEQNRALNVALYARPRGVPGFEIGFSSYHDKLSPFPAFLLDRSVWTAHVVYRAQRLEFLNEGVWTSFWNAKEGRVTVPGFYSQLAYRVGSAWTPYFRVDYANLYGTSNLVAGAVQYVPWRTVLSGGLRYDVSEAVALKFELGHETSRLQPSWIRAALQVAFTF